MTIRDMKPSKTKDKRYETEETKTTTGFMKRPEGLLDCTGSVGERENASNGCNFGGRTQLHPGYIR
jgi:hypothetical protein